MQRPMGIWASLVMLLALPMWAISATLPPEAAVEMDLRWLSPPQVAPQNGVANAEMHPEFTRLVTKFAAEGSSFSWPIRYAIPARQYPIVVLRYSARDLFAAPGGQNTLLQMNLAHSDGQVTPAIIVEVQELVQDGVVHEIRKDLSRVAGDTAIDNIRFSFNAPAGGGRLDIHELRFEPGPAGVAPFALPREPVQFVVTDQNGAAIPDAEVRAGLIERRNWTTLGTTDGAGQVTMPVIRPVRPDGTAVDPVEAMVLKDGFVPQYVAPVEFPRTGPVQVKLAPASAQTSEGGPAAVPIGQEPDRTVYVPSETTVYYETSPSVVYVERYAPFWWVPRTYVGYHPYHSYYYGHSHYGYLNYRYNDRHGSSFRRVDDDRHDHDSWAGSRGRVDIDGRNPGTPPPPVASTPRERTREQIMREVDRGNEPATGIEDSAIYRRAEKNPRGVTPTPVPDRGDRYRTESRGSSEVDRGNEPDARPGSSAPRRVEAPRPSSPAPARAPAPAPARAPAPSPRQPERIASPAPAAPAPAPAPDRGDRYRRDGGGDRDRGNEPDARPRSIAPTVAPAPRPSIAREPRREMPAAAAIAPAPRPAPAPPVVTRERRPTPPIVSAPAAAPRPAAPTVTMPRRVEPAAPRRMEPTRDLATEIRRGNEPVYGGGRDIGVPRSAPARVAAPQPAPRMEAPRQSAAPPARSSPSPSMDRGSRYSR